MEYFHLGFASRVDDSEVFSGGAAFYQPHKAVFKQSETSPLRVVFEVVHMGGINIRSMTA